jgi:lactoylglutathione lyase
MAEGIVAVSHIGVCVTDIERSRRFYRDGLGFQEVAQFEVGLEFGAVMEVEGTLELTSVFLRREGVSIELLGYRNRAVEGDGTRRKMTQLGLTHLSLLVQDVDAVAEHLRGFGGTVLPSTRLSAASGEFVYCLDPDGIRIELMRLAAGPVGA